MKNSIKLYLSRYYIYFGVVIFALISSLCIIFISDDYIWYFVYEKDFLKNYRMPNGRYLTNIITYLMVHYPLCRVIFYTLFFSGLLFIISKLTNVNHENKKTSLLLAFFFFLLMPPRLYAETINWLSAFPNYILSFLLISVYIYFLFVSLFTDKKVRKVYSPLLFLLGILSSLCVENITLYNIVLALSSIIIIKKFKNRFSLNSILYFAGVLIGSVIMFSNHNYHNIKNGTESLSNRGFEFSFADIYFNVFEYIVIHFSKEFWVVNIVICFAVTFFVFKKGINEYKYSKICTIIVWIFAFYSFFTSCFCDIVSTTHAMKLRAVELSFAFLFIVSLCYIFSKYLDKRSAFKCIFFIISSVVVSAPFAIITPVTPRCFFSDYMFWLLIAAELSLSVLSQTNTTVNKYISSFLCLFIFLFSISITGINVVNKYYDTARFKFLCQQVNEGSKQLQFVELPYDIYTWDFLRVKDLFEATWDGGFSYGQVIFMYYGIDEGIDFDNISYNTITTSDYNLYISE